MNASKTTTSPKLTCETILTKWAVDSMISDSAVVADLILRVNHVRWTRNWADWPPQTSEEHEGMWDEIARAVRILLDQVVLEKVTIDGDPALMFGNLLRESEYRPG